MNYLRYILSNYKKIFTKHRELLLNLINFQIFLRVFAFIVLFWVAILFQRSLLWGDQVQLNYEALRLLRSPEVVFYGVLYIFLFFFFVLLEKIWLNLILFQNEKNPEFLLKNIYKELVKNLRKIAYLFFLEFAIISFIIGMFLYTSMFIYISIWFWTISWILLLLLSWVFIYLFIKTYLFFIFVNFEVFYVEKNVFEAFSLSIRWVNKKKTIWHLFINYWLIISTIVIFNFIVTSLILILWSLILTYVSIITIVIVSLIMAFWFLLVILSSFLLMSLLSIIEFQIYKKEIRKEKPKLWIRPPDSFHINKWILIWTLITMSSLMFIPLFFTLSDYDKLPTITAHRWASLERPANTISAFKRATEQSVDYIELDIQETRDGKIIVFHDKNLKNKTGYNGNVYETDYEDISRLSVTEVFDDISISENIPTLDEVFELAQKTNIKLNLELKVYRYGHDYSRKIARLLEKWGMEERVVITSLDTHIIEKFRKHNLITPRWIIVSLWVWDIFDNDFEFISVNSQILTLPMVIRSKIYKKDLHVWIFNESDDIDDILRFSPDNIIVDDIKWAMSKRNSLQNLSDGKKLRIKIKTIFDYLTGKVR